MTEARIRITNTQVLGRVSCLAFQSKPLIFLISTGYVLEAVLKIMTDVTHVRRFVMLSVAEASFPPILVVDSSTPLRCAQNDRVVAHSREGAK